MIFPFASFAEAVVYTRPELTTKTRPSEIPFPSNNLLIKMTLLCVLFTASGLSAPCQRSAGKGLHEDTKTLTGSHNPMRNASQSQRSQCFLDLSISPAQSGSFLPHRCVWIYHPPGPAAGDSAECRMFQTGTPWSAPPALGAG